MPVKKVPAKKGAKKGSKIEGFCHACVLEKNIGEIKGLYFTSEIVGLGYGRKVFEEAINWLDQNKCKKIVITATKTARAFYEKMGFSCINEMNVNVRGTCLICYKMEKNL